MRHPSEGVLRRLVDEPAGVTDDDRAHVAGCPTCLRALETTRAEARLVDAALARLPHKQAAALVLRHSGLSYAEVAAALDLSPGSVGTTVRRAESVLHKELNRHASPE